LTLICVVGEEYSEESLNMKQTVKHDEFHNYLN